MALQGLLPYEDESEKHETGLTAMAGGCRRILIWPSWQVCGSR